MTNLSNSQISILHYWNNGIRSAHFIHSETKIPLSTVNPLPPIGVPKEDVIK